MATAAITANLLTAALFMASTLGTTVGAENVPFGLYTFVKDADGRPELQGGSYAADGSIERGTYDAPGQAYHGKPRSVYMLVKHNTTGIEYRISASALQAAIKATGDVNKFNPDAMDLQQVVAEVQGYRRATVSLEPTAEAVTA